MQPQEAAAVSKEKKDKKNKVNRNGWLNNVPF